MIAEWDTVDPRDLEGMGVLSAEAVLGHLERLGVLEPHVGRLGRTLVLNPFVAALLSRAE